MKTTLTVDDLTAEQWQALNRDLLTAYTFGPLDARVCTTFVHGPEERHAELPAWTLVQLLGRLVATAVMFERPAPVLAECTCGSDACSPEVHQR